MKVFGFEVLRLHSYRNVILDFDGTIVDSIPAKNIAFQNALARVLAVTSEIVDYLNTTAHLSRTERLGEIMIMAGRSSPQCFEDVKSALDEAMAAVYHDVQASEQLVRFLKSVRGSKSIHIVSAAPEEDLNFWITKNSLAESIDQVVGAPRDKGEVVNEIVGKEAHPAAADFIYVGDTEYDKEIAVRNNIDFMWSEFSIAEGI